MDRILGVGFIGCGGFVRGNHLPNVAANPRLRVHALCDLDVETLTPLAQRYGPLYVTADASRLCSDPEVDLLIIGTKPDIRVSLIRAAAQAGKPMYVEKPLSTGWDDSREILQLLREYPVPLQVGFNRAYAPIMQEARRLFRKQRGLAAGRGGAPAATVISYRICGEFDVFPQHHKDALTVLGESAVIHEGVHIFDLLNWLTESEPLSLFCAGGATDDNIITLEYPGDIHATIILSNQSTEGFPKERLEVFSNCSTLVMNEFIELQTAQIPGESDQLFPLKSDPGGDPGRLGTEAELRAGLRAWRAGLTREQLDAGYYYDSRPTVNKGHYEAIEYFRQCLTDNRAPETDARRGALATVMGLEALRSLRQRRAIDLDFSTL